ncbi:MAG: alkyl hydroperoxide reductase [Ignavibacteria bacterium GWB2_35_6b]|nr:MAG: alkyl hydroperoxide reductase [Ignavibacteria bacterium GWB2_35_6b]
MVEEGKKAPEFILPDSDGNKVSLKDFEGKNVVIYFYPKDLTPGCTVESCDFRDAHPDFKNINTVVLGLSIDSQKKHRKFRDKYELPFTLLSDEDKTVVNEYGVWKEKSMFGRKYMGIERTTVIIGPDGIVKKIFTKVSVPDHVEEVLKVLKEKLI